VTPDDGSVCALCHQLGVSQDELVEATDRLGLNVSVLDDLAALENPSARKPAVKRPRSPKRDAKIPLARMSKPRERLRTRLGAAG
jgi:hypothetical protein